MDAIELIIAKVYNVQVVRADSWTLKTKQFHYGILYRAETVLNKKPPAKNKWLLFKGGLKTNYLLKPC